jgi:hypothetical protein
MVVHRQNLLLEKLHVIVQYLHEQFSSMLRQHHKDVLWVIYNLDFEEEKKNNEQKNKIFFDFIPIILFK